MIHKVKKNSRGVHLQLYLCENNQTKKLIEVNMTLWTQIFQLLLDVAFQSYTPHPKSKEILPTMIVLFFSGYWQPFCPPKKGHDSFKVKTWSPYVFFFNGRIHTLMGFNETMHRAPHIQRCIYIEKKSQL